jgi:hypothetical protein
MRGALFADGMVTVSAALETAWSREKPRNGSMSFGAHLSLGAVLIWRVGGELAFFPRGSRVAGHTTTSRGRGIQ